MSKNKITEILQHDISWWVNSKAIKELDDSSKEHIAYCITEGIHEGQLCISYGKDNSKETTGWWKIIDWKNICLMFYNGPLETAREKFDEEWCY